MKPYSPETLAERWDCSAEKVRRMVHAGELDAFRLGKLIRIPASEVERFECSTASSDTGGSSASPSLTRSEAALESRLARMTGDEPKLSLVTSGAGSTPPHRIG